MQMIRVEPFDSFKYICKLMAECGYMIPLGVKLSPTKQKIYNAYRIATIIILVVFDLQHIIFIIQVFGNMNLIVASLFSLIVTLNVTLKLIFFFINTHRFEQLHDDINCPLFEASTAKDEELMIENKRQMERIATVTNRAVVLCAAFWFAVPFINRMSNPNSIVPAYFPFNTKTFSGFFGAVSIHSAVMFWTGYGHLAYTCFVAALYSQSCIQLKIIRHRLENIVDENDDGALNGVYRDMVDDKIQQRFVHCVLRYNTVIRFTMEVEYLNRTTAFIQLVASSGVICMVVYKMSSLPSALGFEFTYLSVYLFCLLVELFLYCYYGSILTYESHFVNTSMYLSDWPALSPRFRRLMLIGMARWLKPFNPLAANLVPLSLNTFVRVLRIAYTLYTVLKES